jgi:hypothetical protein
MSKTRDALRRKFAVLREDVRASAAVPVVKRLRRSKGQRRRLTFRLPVATVRNLQVLKLALGKDVNVLCEEFLERAVAEKLSEVRATAKPGEWDVIVSCAKGLDG